MLKKIKGICKFYGWFCVIYWAIIATAARARVVRGYFVNDEEDDVSRCLLKLFTDSILEIYDYFRDFCLRG